MASAPSVFDLRWKVLHFACRIVLCAARMCTHTLKHTRARGCVCELQRKLPKRVTAHDSPRALCLALAPWHGRRRAVQPSTQACAACCSSCRGRCVAQRTIVSDDAGKHARRMLSFTTIYGYHSARCADCRAGAARWRRSTEACWPSRHEDDACPSLGSTSASSGARPALLAGDLSSTRHAGRSSLARRREATCAGHRQGFPP